MVSVIIPNYNHALFLEERIKSVLDQTYQNFEVIILDDCSTDNSQEIILKFKDHPKVSHISFNKSNSGSTFRQWEKGIRLAKGDLIWVAESDDKADAKLLATLVPIMENDNKLGIAYCQSYRINEKGVVMGTWLDWTESLSAETFIQNFSMNGVLFIEKFLIHKNVIPNASAVLFRRDYYIGTGGVDINLRYCSDWLLWLKILLNYDVAYISYPLNFFRCHDKSVIATALLANTPEKYFDLFDKTLRIKFKNYLSKFKAINPHFSHINSNNNKYIAISNGSEGLFYLKQDKLKGWWLIIESSFFFKNFRFLKPAFLETLRILRLVFNFKG